MLEEFEQRAGYDLRPWLPVVMEVKEKYRLRPRTGANAATTDSLRTNQVRDDFNQVLSDLYHDHHLRPCRTGRTSLGMWLRAQAYGLETDGIASAANLDMVEGESLGFKNLDDYRGLPSAGTWAGRPCCPARRALQRCGVQHDVGTTAPSRRSRTGALHPHSIFAAG